VKLDVYIYDEAKLKYETFRIWRLKHLFLLLGIVVASAFFSVLVFYTCFRTSREKDLGAELKSLYADYNEINRRNVEAEIMLSRARPDDSTIADLRKILPCIPSVPPLDLEHVKRTKPWGYRTHPVRGTREFHSGMDFSARPGTPILATGDGTVQFVGNRDSGYGNYVVVDHGYGYKTLYAHMSSFAVEQGQSVAKKDTLGFVGSTGTTTGPHVHYEVEKDGKNVNPAHYTFGR